MNMKSMRQIQLWIYRLTILLMFVQIVFGVLWMVNNFDTIPCFGDTSEYLEMSVSFNLDEYRPILYPLFLNCIRRLDEEHYNRIVYLVQTVLCWFAMSYAVCVISSVLQQRTPYRMTVSRTKEARIGRSVVVAVFGGLFLTTIPMITFMNFTVLTDSIANSLLVFFLAISVEILYGKGASFRRCLGLAVSLILQSILRADRLYSGLLLLAILTIIALVREGRRFQTYSDNQTGMFMTEQKRKGIAWNDRRSVAISMALVALLSFAAAKFISAQTQIAGSRGRVQTSMSFVLLDRVVWPNMVANYEHFPQEIKDNVSMEEAQSFDSHNNKVMYEFAPVLESRVGREKAEEYYRKMAEVVWEHDADKVLLDIGGNFGMTMVSPVMHYLAVKGVYRKNNIGWNMHCLSQATPELTNVYDMFGFYILIVLLGIEVVIGTIDVLLRIRGRLRGRWKLDNGCPLSPFIISSFLICLWFSVGDGAPPNDRYTLIVYTTFGLMAIMPTIMAMIVDRTRDGAGSDAERL